MSYTGVTSYKKYCAEKNKWCEFVASSGYCSLTACVNSNFTKTYTVDKKEITTDDIKARQKKIGAVADGIPGFETLKKTVDACEDCCVYDCYNLCPHYKKSPKWKWLGQFINDMEDTAIEMLLATGWLYRHDKEISISQGHWNHEVWAAPLSDSTMNVYQCSECNLHYQSKSNFCPNCGADMRASMKRGAE